MQRLTIDIDLSAEELNGEVCLFADNGLSREDYCFLNYMEVTELATWLNAWITEKMGED